MNGVAALIGRLDHRDADGDAVYNADIGAPEILSRLTLEAKLSFRIAEAEKTIAARRSEVWATWVEARVFNGRIILMPGIHHTAALIMIGWAFATPAMGQDECLASFNVNPSKSLTYLSIGPNASDRIETTISCSVAGQMRDELFLTGKTIDPNLLSNADQLRARILRIKEQLASGKMQLEEATTEPAHFSAVLRLKDTVLAAGLASATIGCILSEEACKPAVRASVVLYDLAVSASKVATLAQARAQALREVDTVDSMLQSIQAQLNDSIAQQSKRRFHAVLSEMCIAIKQQCK
jgi:hypothetical protein